MKLRKPRNAGVEQRPFFRTLRGQLTVLNLGIGLIPALLVAYVSFTLAQGNIRASVINRLQAVDNSYVNTLTSWYDNLHDATVGLAHAVQITGDNDPSSPLGIEDILRLRGSRDDADAYKTAYDAAFTAIDAPTQINSYIMEATLVDTKGLVIMSDGKSGEPQQLHRAGDVSQESYFVNGQTDVYFSDPVAMQNNARLFTLFVSAPIRNRSGALIGVIVVRSSSAFVAEELSQFSDLGNTGEVIVLSRDKTMLNQARHIADNTVLQTTWPNVSASGETGSGPSVDYRGVPVYQFWSTMPGLNWLIVGKMDTAEIDSSTVIFGYINIAIILITAVVVAIVTFLGARTLTRPIQELARTAKQVANGDLDARANLKVANEFQTLADDFNSMTANLKSTMATQVAKDYIDHIIDEYRNFVVRVAEGDLTARLELNAETMTGSRDLYELGMNLNHMVDGLTEITWQIRETTASITAAAAEILASSTQQSSSTVQQDAAVAETVATVEQIRATVSQSSERAQSVADTAHRSLDVSRSGQEAVYNSIQGMQSIRDRVESIAENILALSERTQQIGQIIATVNEIADQSKLLALNASIEAARAGEDGKGFAVVAMEVRQLAEQSRDATSRVRSILSEIQKATNSAVMVTEEGSKGAEQGMTLVELAGQSITQLAGVIEESAQAASQIAASASQQTLGMNQLAMAMTSIKQATNEASISTHQTEKSARDLTEMARRLQEAASRYRIAEATLGGIRA